MCVLKTEHTWKGTELPHIYALVEDNIWAINTMKKKLEMWNFNCVEKNWTQTEWKNKDFCELDGIGDRCTTYVSKKKIYVWQLTPKEQLLMFDTETFEWLYLIDLPCDQRADFVVLNGMCYVYDKGPRFRIVSLNTKETKYMEYPCSQDGMWTSLVEMNGVVYFINIDRNSTRTIYKHNEDDTFTKISETPPECPRLRSNDSNQSVVWSSNNQIYQAIVTEFCQRYIKIDCFDIHSKQWVEKYRTGIIIRNNRTIVGNDRETHVICVANKSVKIQTIHFFPTLVELTLTTLADNTTPHREKMITTKMPDHLQKRFKLTLGWRRSLKQRSARKRRADPHWCQKYPDYE